MSDQERMPITEFVALLNRTRKPGEIHFACLDSKAEVTLESQPDGSAELHITGSPEAGAWYRKHVHPNGDIRKEMLP